MIPANSSRYNGHLSKFNIPVLFSSLIPEMTIFTLAISCLTTSKLSYFLDSKIIADGDCSHGIKRHLLLGRKFMTNVDRILISRDITLSTKVHPVRAMVFPEVMYGCESWTIKKAEC